MKQHVALITNALPDSGVGARAYEIGKRIAKNTDIAATPVLINGSTNTLRIGEHTTQTISAIPGPLGTKSISWIRLASKIPEFDIYDLTNQTLSFIAKKRKPSIVTIHDIIELTDPQDYRAYFINRYLMSGIMKATKLIAVSEYTKRVAARHFHIPEKHIEVIPNGVSDSYHVIPKFHSTIAYKQLAQRLPVLGRKPILVYVGSEHPRKNFTTVLKVVHRLKEKFPDILLVKVGDAGLRIGRKQTLETIDKLELAKHVHLVGRISVEQINELYNIADALLFPSHYEGFGMTPLEAMAAGCPVVCSNATSIPEVVGEAAMLHNPSDIEGFANSIERLMGDTDLRQAMIEKGKQRATLFSWDAAADSMVAVYRSLLQK